MSWEDRYFGPPPSTSRAIFAAAGTLMICFGALLAIGSTQGAASLGTRVLLVSSIALVLYGVDLFVRALRPRKPGRSFAGFSGALRLAAAILFASLFVGLGVYAIVRGDLISGGFIAAAGITCLFLLLVARIQQR